MNTVVEKMQQTLYEYHQLSAGKKIEFERNTGLEPAGVYLTDAELMLVCMLNKLAEIWNPISYPDMTQIRVKGTRYGAASISRKKEGIPILTDTLRNDMMNAYKTWLKER